MTPHPHAMSHSPQPSILPSLPSPCYPSHYPNTPTNTTLLLFFFTHSTSPWGHFLSKFKRVHLLVTPAFTLPYPTLLSLTHPSLPPHQSLSPPSSPPTTSSPTIHNTTLHAYTAFSLPTLADSCMTIFLPWVAPTGYLLISHFSPLISQRAVVSGEQRDQGRCECYHLTVL